MDDTQDTLHAILAHVAAIHLKVDELVAFTTNTASAISGAANAGGMQGAMVRSMLPVGMVDAADAYIDSQASTVLNGSTVD